MVLGFGGICLRTKETLQVLMNRGLSLSMVSTLGLRDSEKPKVGIWSPTLKNTGLLGFDERPGPFFSLSLGTEQSLKLDDRLASCRRSLSVSQYETFFRSLKTSVLKRIAFCQRDEKRHRPCC